MGMLTPNFSDALLVFLYGVMGTLFVQWVMGMFKLKERVERLERVLYEASSRLIDCEEDMYALAEVQRLARRERLLAEKERPRLRAALAPAERRTRARSPRRAKK
jgi:hypothetical protein